MIPNISPVVHRATITTIIDNLRTLNDTIVVMESTEIRAITWEAPEHRHIEKSNDWYWALGIVAVAGACAAFILGNVLFGIVIILGTGTMILYADKTPRIIPFAVTMRGIRIDDALHPYSSLESYYIDEECPEGPQLLAKSKKTFAPILVIPIPEEQVDNIDDLIAVQLPSEEIEEPISERLLEMFGF